MNESEYAVCQALERSSSFATTHAQSFPAGSRAAGDFARIAPLLAAIGHADFQPGLPASPATAAKEQLFSELWEDLKAIARTARVIDRQEPGFATAYRLTDKSQREILHTATAILAKLKEPGTAAKFVAYAMSENFVADLESDLAAAGALGGEQNDDHLGGTGDTARVRALVREGRELLESLDASVRNRFRDDPETLAEWRAAARIHRRKRTATPPPAPAPPAPPV